MLKTSQSPTVVNLFEAELAPGLEELVSNEIRKLPQTKIITTGKGIIQFQYSGDFSRLLRLKTVNALYLLNTFSVPRPKALLGHQHFHALLNLITQAQHLHPAGSFQTLYIDAAGSESSVMQRLKTELATHANLQPTDEKGDLLIRLRPSVGHDGWDALVRLSPRPLATRAWRIQNYEGALNAAVAHAMINLTSPAPTDIFLNLCSGSGTLLIERFMAGAFEKLIGIEITSEALNITRMNSDAARISSPQLKLLQADVRRLPIVSNSVNKLCADLPFGQLSGTHTANTKLYPAVLNETARVACVDAHFVLITHEIRLIDSLLQRFSAYWKQEQTFKITLNGLHPRIYVLRRTDAIYSL